ncbi:Tetracyclin repressor, C-terminal all-alpha domain [Friedmanniella luteola]|uniref:Tetracyclin repressor, C-terminal all-alpha domain n=1 Tax=Friedmanniella luteola TaxID=546871 RepID=A0A1H1MVG0_9ACTN|nr:TetR family transcriptional regulator [Friedmanniella luteola]SDR90670.1 Tetracyclin repressor, C-terminal all-alpha domain [Friedmanniella luteola]
MPDATPEASTAGPTRPSVWTRPDRGGRGPQPEHSREAIAAAAVALADAGGLGAATMRAVAAALGTAAASLYRYLSSRDDLLDLMVDAVLAELPPEQPPGPDWLEDLVDLGRAQLDLHRRHPWLLEAGLRGTAVGPHGTDHIERCLRLMAPAGAGSAARMEAVALITGVVSLFARPAPVDTRALAPADLFAVASADRHPHLVAALTRPTPPGPRPDLFEHTLRSVLRGLLVEPG